MLASALTLTMFGCGSDTTSTSTSPSTTPANPPTVPEVVEKTNVDLGGIHIKIAQWGDESLFIENPIDEYEEAVNVQRAQALEDYNFTFEWYNSGTWATMLERLSTGVIAGDPAGNVFRLGIAHVATAVEQGLLWDLTQLDAFDINDPNFHNATSETSTFGDGVYAYCIDSSEFGDQYMYWNKRLFEEAGIDPDLPYDLQASGEWTWDALFEISDILTRDTTGDGVIDTYAHVQQPAVTARNFLYSNNAAYITKDENGKFINNTLSNEVYDALEASVIFDSRYTQQVNWDVNVNEIFMNGGAAMLTGQQWLVKQWSANMEDEVGCVMFPKGPNNTGDGYYSSINTNCFAIPSNFSKDEAEAILTAHYQFNRTPDAYIDDVLYTQFTPYYTDSRAVNETMVYAQGGDNNVVDYVVLFTDIKVNEVTNFMRWSTESIQELLETHQATIDSILAKVNG